MSWPRGLPQGDVDMTNEVLSRVKIDARLSAQVWNTTSSKRPSALRSSGPTSVGVANDG